MFLHAGKRAKLGFYDHAARVCVFRNLFGQLYVLVKGQLARVYHDGRKAVVHALLAKLKAVAVVEVQAYRQPAVFDGSLDELFEINHFRILPRAVAHLKYEGRAALDARLHDALNGFHIVYVERSDGISAVVCFGKHFLACCQWHFEFDPRI